jgi:hypothetical protein
MSGTLRPRLLRRTGDVAMLRVQFDERARDLRGSEATISSLLLITC